MPTKKTTTKQPEEATIQDLVDAIYDLSSKLDDFAPIAELASHLNEYWDDSKHVVTAGIPICLQDISPFTQTELSKAVHKALVNDKGDIVISVKNYDDDSELFSVSVYSHDD